MKGKIVSKKVKAGVVAILLVVLGAISFVVTNVVAEDPPLSTGDGDVYIGNVTVMLNATDDWSGVDYTMYGIAFSIPGGPSGQSEWMVYLEPFVVSGRGNYTISYYSVDNDGNIEDTKTTSFSIYADIVAPVTNCTLAGELKPE